VPFIAEVVAADEPERWRAAGFAVDGDGVCRIGTVRVRLDPGAGRKGIVGWVLADLESPADEIDGLPTTVGELSAGDAPHHPIGARLIDHVVVITPDLSRTIAALEGIGLPLRRTRDSSTYGNPMRQAFFRMGEVIVEVVGGHDPDPRGGPARFYGLALTLDSLDAAKELLGDRMGTPKPAVQEGRSITSLHAELNVPVAVMSPEPRP